MSKKLSEADEARYDAMSERAEQLDTLPETAIVIGGDGPEFGRSYLENLLG